MASATAFNDLVSHALSQTLGAKAVTEPRGVTVPISWQSKYFRLVCRYCDSANLPEKLHCTQCGAPLPTVMQAQPAEIKLIDLPKAVLYRFDKGLEEIEYILELYDKGVKTSQRISVTQEEIKHATTVRGISRQQALTDMFLLRIVTQTGLPPEFFNRFTPERSSDFLGGTRWVVE